MPKSFTLALLLTAATSSMTVAAVAANGENTQPSVKKAKPKKICKTSDEITGSRIAKRTCKTEDEWADVASDQELQSKSKG